MCLINRMSLVSASQYTDVSFSVCCVSRSPNTIPTDTRMRRPSRVQTHRQTERGVSGVSTAVTRRVGVDVWHAPARNSALFVAHRSRTQSHAAELGLRRRGSVGRAASIASVSEAPVSRALHSALHSPLQRQGCYSPARDYPNAGPPAIATN